MTIRVFVVWFWIPVASLSGVEAILRFVSLAEGMRGRGYSLLRGATLRHLYGEGDPGQGVDLGLCPITLVWGVGACPTPLFFGPSIIKNLMKKLKQTKLSFSIGPGPAGHGTSLGGSVVPTEPGKQQQRTNTLDVHHTDRLTSHPTTTQLPPQPDPSDIVTNHSVSKFVS